MATQAGPLPTDPRPAARWRPSRAVVGVAGALLLTQVAAATVSLVAGDGAVGSGVAILVADALLVLAVVLLARRGARLAPSTFGLVRTRWWPALGWTAALGSAALSLEGRGRC